MRRKTVLLALAVALAAAMAVLGANRAIAATSITGTTSVTNHPDTTAASGPACTSSVNGPVWADDNYTSTITATKDDNPANTYSVVVTDSGTFTAFADPNTCAALSTFGPFSGTYDLTVTSATAPSAAGLHSGYDGAVSTSTMVGDLFGGHATSIVGGAYDFSYQNGNYVQDTSGQRGAVVLPTKSNVVQVKNRATGKCLNEDKNTGLLSTYNCLPGTYSSLRWQVDSFANGPKYLVSVQTGQFVRDNGSGGQLSLTNIPAPMSFRNGGVFEFPDALVMTVNAQGNFVKVVSEPGLNPLNNGRWDFGHI